MFQNFKYAIIADIGTFEMTFYDEDNQSELESYCRRHLISYLVGKNRKNIYKLSDNGFHQEDLTNKVCFKPYDRIFDFDILKKFEKIKYDDVGFIVENDSIKGVVHIVGYNSKFIKIELYKALFEFDENLRKLLLNNFFTNSDFITWVKRQKDKENKGIEGYWSKRYNSLMPENKEFCQKLIQSRKSANAFEAFYLSDLLEYTIDLELLDEEIVSKNHIKNVRNSVAHAMNASSVMGIQNDEVYSFENLKEFVERSRNFFEAYEYLEAKVMES